MIRHRHRVKPAGLLITPMIDMFTVILIFLIASYSPESAKIQKSDQIQIPKSSLTLTKAPRLQVEVTSEYLHLNGKAIENLNPSQSESQVWKVFEQQLAALSLKDEKGKQRDEPVLVMADKEASYQLIERAVAHIAAAGFSEVYFLTEKEAELE